MLAYRTRVTAQKLGVRSASQHPQAGAGHLHVGERDELRLGDGLVRLPEHALLEEHLQRCAFPSAPATPRACARGAIKLVLLSIQHELVELVEQEQA